MVDYGGDYSGRSQYYLLLRVNHTSQNASGTYARVQIGAVSKQGWGSWTADAGEWAVSAGATIFAGGRSNLDFRPDATGKVIWLYDNIHFFQHDWAGNFAMWFSTTHDLPLFGRATAAGAINFPSIGTVPSAPAKPVLTFTAPKTYRMNWWAPSSNGGQPITSYEVQLGTRADFAGVNVLNVGNIGEYIRNDLTEIPHYFRVRAVNSRGAGPWSATLQFTPASVPSAPVLGVPGNVSPARFTVPYTQGNSGGDAITSTEVQWSTSPTFATVPWSQTFAGSGNGVSDPEGFYALTPSTTYYVRARSKNSVGWGAWSNVVSQTTLTADAPGISVTPSVNGRSVEIRVSPPGGTTGVTSYKLERRLKGTTSASGWTTTTTTTTFSGLTPGAEYEWRAAAVFGEYVSPWSPWVTTTQPAPTVSAGAYFDGNTPAGADQTYRWDGAAGMSLSRATAKSVVSWAGNVPTIGVVNLQSVSGGRFGNKAGLYTFTKAMPSSAKFGMSLTENNALVQPGGVYSARISVMTSQLRQAYPQVAWMRANGGVISFSSGATVRAEAGEWVDLVLPPVTAPAGAVRAAVVAVVFGSTESPIPATMTVTVDAAAITLGGPYPYFDGSLPSASDWVYAWEGAPHASVSSRTDSPEPESNLLRDPDCAPLPTPPKPPVIPSECIDEVGMWRRYTVVIPASEVRLWLEAVPTIILSTGSDPERQVRVRFYRDETNSVAEATSGTPAGEMIVTYIPPMTELTLDGVSERSWASVNGGEEQPAGHLLYGTGGIPASWPVLSCGSGYVVTLDVPLESPAGNLSTRVMMTQRG